MSARSPLLEARKLTVGIGGRVFCRGLDLGLAPGGRPLPTGLDALRKMEAERMPLYRAASDAAVDNTGRLENTVETAVQAFETTFDA